ncbi:uncharacterized protein LOC126610019 isoform X4 [Malus sylvestris]|uniref:uncharacterized protein LOC126610019 isoform X4 n=1 Tax=Malus sylvestris TaxID=3752 RepID=UPI0021AD1BF2|nr:uncharacterized protein LOC126610019 isoform X4 [Malus sylvestris]
MRFFQVSISFSPLLSFDFILSLHLPNLVTILETCIFKIVNILDCRFFLVKSGLWLNMTTTVVPTVLSYKNYKDWSFRMKTYFLAEDLWDIVSGTVTKPPEGEEHKAWKKKDAKALYAIQNSCGDNTYKLIKGKTTAKEAWDTLVQKVRYGSVNLSDEDSSDENSSDEDSHDEANKPVCHVYPTPPDHDATLESAMEEALSTRGAGHDESIQETFVKYVKSNDWDNAIKFLRQHPQAASARMTDWPYTTALHYAIGKRCSVRIIQQLVDLMANALLETADSFGSALDCLINDCPEWVEAAECIVKKNLNIVTSVPSNRVPLVLVAQGTAKGERLARFLYSLTPHEQLNVSQATHLISLGFHLQRLDIAWDLIQRYPKLAITKDLDKNIPLVTLASNGSAFKSGSRLNLWENLIYHGIRIKPLPPINKEKHESDQKENQGHHLISSGMTLFRGLLANLQTLLGITHIYQKKLMHERVQQFLPLMWKASEGDGNILKRQKLIKALCVAAERGHVEYIFSFLKCSTLDFDAVQNEKGQNLYQIAAECRHHKIYNLIHVHDQLRKNGITLYFYPTAEMNRVGTTESYLGKKDDFGNNMLHTVATISPSSQIHDIQGAALQMQRELQWFKEVERIANPMDLESVNKDDKTPRKVFTENHKELGKEAEKSMKEIATSCTVVGALIVTIMFAAAFTVPGGNDKNDEKAGPPTFLTNKVYTTFIVLDAISLFSSTTSVIMFLGILTSRYFEDDFYKSLPIKMIIGLLTLFLSIATMMIVFSCGLYIMLDEKSSIVVPSILLATVPVTSFIWMQFPLLVELFISTFGRGIFYRNQKKLF